MIINLRGYTNFKPLSINLSNEIFGRSLTNIIKKTSRLFDNYAKQSQNVNNWHFKYSTMITKAVMFYLYDKNPKNHRSKLEVVLLPQNEEDESHLFTIKIMNNIRQRQIKLNQALH